jgi:Gluconate 2-dehydrogenase subunit 3
MNRRDVLKNVLLVTGSTFFLPDLAFADIETAFEEEGDLTFFTNAQRKLVTELSELILPRTSTPGAKDAKITPFIEVILQDCYKAADQKMFLAGLTQLDTDAKAKFGKSFLRTGKANQIALLTAAQAAAAAAPREKSAPMPFFTFLKGIVMFTFFNSKVGATEVLVYKQVPGSYQADIPLEKGQKAWALG